MLLTRHTGRRRHAAVAVVSMFAYVAMTGAASANWSWSGDRVLGAGLNNPPLSNIAGFVLDARSGPAGENPFGFGAFALQVPDPTVKFTYNAGIVQCLRVSGNTATLVYKIKWVRRLPGDMSTVDAARVYVQDNGDPTKLTQPVDRVRNTLFDSTRFPSFLECPDPADPKTTEFINKADPLTYGDTIVKDG